MTIVGVVGDVRQASPASRPGPELYMPLRQHPYTANEVQIVAAVRCDHDGCRHVCRRAADCDALCCPGGGDSRRDGGASGSDGRSSGGIAWRPHGIDRAATARRKRTLCRRRRCTQSSGSAPGDLELLTRAPQAHSMTAHVNRTRVRRRQKDLVAATRQVVPVVERLTVLVRGQRVILAGDLAEIYGVEARTLNQAVKRNAGRFPPDFVFRLTRAEAMRIHRSRSQSVILKRGANIKYTPLAFTEHGATMAASVLNSSRAVQMSIFVVRAFLRLRKWVAGRAERGSPNSSDGSANTMAASKRSSKRCANSLNLRRRPDAASDSFQETHDRCRQCWRCPARHAVSSSIQLDSSDIRLALIASPASLELSCIDHCVSSVTSPS